MREPVLVEAAFRSPGHCFICGGHEGMMVDTGVEVTGDGRFYICARVCVPMVAAAAGYLPRDVVDAEREAAGRAVAHVATLEELLEAERGKSATFAETLRLLGRPRPKAKAETA